MLKEGWEDSGLRVVSTLPFSAG